ncbi:uncharacterized protein EV422DRAFT_611494 [Fimicolochytrium jonesii]|uniref:uncharacterized protein n=1 Tax=Fimicolochytrium jonesii TaxID=1396493 RepID=UPI0022FE9E76|nr:uncharacterized protein EV422DRAFT_611494 [Fimicolochytrium jonesii]KAI8823416.1 hypothetical protein EV422DRAFT_611494 [Fimicolochytrium jonesii]
MPVQCQPHLGQIRVKKPTTTSQQELDSKTVCTPEIGSPAGFPQDFCGGPASRPMQDGTGRDAGYPTAGRPPNGGRHRKAQPRLFRESVCRRDIYIALCDDPRQPHQPDSWPDSRRRLAFPPRFGFSGAPTWLPYIFNPTSWKPHDDTSFAVMFYINFIVPCATTLPTVFAGFEMKGGQMRDSSIVKVISIRRNTDAINSGLVSARIAHDDELVFDRSSHPALGDLSARTFLLR